jgi:hypothetical protein
MEVTEKVRLDQFHKQQLNTTSLILKDQTQINSKPRFRPDYKNIFAEIQKSIWSE